MSYSLYLRPNLDCGHDLYIKGAGENSNDGNIYLFQFLTDRFQTFDKVSF